MLLSCLPIGLVKPDADYMHCLLTSSTFAGWAMRRAALVRLLEIAVLSSGVTIELVARGLRCGSLMSYVPEFRV